MKFTKMHGLGNDFIVVNSDQVDDNVTDLAIAVCERNFGIGADGLVYILPSTKADIKMRIFNSDGTEAEQCGNAIRCVAKYVYDHELCKKDIIRVETNPGIQTVEIYGNNGVANSVRVDMGAPILSAKLVPTIFEEEVVLNKEIIIDDVKYKFTAVSMGNPHAVIFVDEISPKMVTQHGPLIEKHSFFPKKTNVEFVRFINNKELEMNVWERGVGETLACGTGACATAVAAILTGQTEDTVTVHLKGGDLTIEWDRNKNTVFMTGAASEVFIGQWLCKAR